MVLLQMVPYSLRVSNYKTAHIFKNLGICSHKNNVIRHEMFGNVTKSKFRLLSFEHFK